MTTRIHRLWQPGNPQTRVFLPNFWVKLVRYDKIHPPNHVKFEVPLEMTEFDTREYLEKVYKLPIRQIRLEFEQGEMIRGPLLSKKNIWQFGGPHTKVLDKKPDRKYAIVILKKDINFKFPENLYGSEEKVAEKNKELEEVVREQTTRAEKKIKFKPHVHPGAPAWFSV